MIKFIYKKNEDIKCWKRWNKFIKKNKTVWGIIPLNKKYISVEKITFHVEVENIFEKYSKVFKMKPPIIEGYVVTTPFSMINDDKSFSRIGKIYLSIHNISFKVIIHEIFHIYFEKYTKRNIPNYETAKEYFTVILNDIFSYNISTGYPKHEEVRKKIFKVWKKTHSIDECIKILIS